MKDIEEIKKEGIIKALRDEIDCILQVVTNVLDDTQPLETSTFLQKIKTAKEEIANAEKLFIELAKYL